jgi:prophage tail gpP-like protein
LVKVVDDCFGYDDYMLITSVEMERSLEGGCITNLGLTGREAFDVLDVPPERKGARKGRKPKKSPF